MIRYKCKNCGVVLESDTPGEKDTCPMCGNVCCVPKRDGWKLLKIMATVTIVACFIVLTEIAVTNWTRPSRAGSSDEKTSTSGTTTANDRTGAVAEPELTLGDPEADQQLKILWKKIDQRAATPAWAQFQKRLVFDLLKQTQRVGSRQISNPVSDGLDEMGEGMRRLRNSGYQFSRDEQNLAWAVEQMRAVARKSEAQVNQDEGNRLMEQVMMVVEASDLEALQRRLQARLGSNLPPKGTWERQVLDMTDKDISTGR